MRVFLAQLKCPSNHCIIAVAREFETLEAAQVLDGVVMDGFRHLVASRQVKNECLFCRSNQFHVDIHATAYATLDEARPHLNAAQERGAMAAWALRGTRN